MEMSRLMLNDVLRFLLAGWCSFWIWGAASVEGGNDGRGGKNPEDRMNEIVQKMVDIKPGAGLQEFQERVDNILCKFQYKAQGGTKEEWAFVVAKDAKGQEWICTVKRPNGISYLFFEEFKLEVTGAHLKHAILEKQPGVMLPQNEYIIDEKANFVQHRPGKFNSQLNMVQIYAHTTGSKKHDL